MSRGIGISQQFYCFSMQIRLRSSTSFALRTLCGKHRYFVGGKDRIFDQFYLMMKRFGNYLGIWLEVIEVIYLHPIKLLSHT